VVGGGWWGGGGGARIEGWFGWVVGTRFM